MLENKWNIIFFGFVILFVTLPSLEAKILWFNYYPHGLNSYDLTDSKLDQTAKYPILQRPRDTMGLIYDVIKIMNDRQQRQKQLNEEKRCDRLFGSIYGTKQQRLQCLMKLKRKEQLKNIQSKNQFTDEIKKPFADLTREERVDATMRTTFNMPEFSTDYIDFRDLRMRLEDDMRKSNKRKKLFLRSYSSSETDSGSYEMQKSSNYRKPKRFKVIDNGKRQKSDSDDKSSKKASKKRKPSKTKKTKSYWDSDNSDSSDGEYKKPSSKEYYSEGNGGLSSDEVEEPVKPKKYKSNKKKEYYLQGGRIIADEDEDEDRRRRLPNFLPKRYHWAEDEIHNLGFFWFNGPQGRYSHVPVRP